LKIGEGALVARTVKGKGYSTPLRGGGRWESPHPLARGGCRGKFGGSYVRGRQPPPEKEENVVVRASRGNFSEKEDRQPRGVGGIMENS